MKSSLTFKILSTAYIAGLFFIPPIIQVFGVILFALYLFTTEKFPVDITAFFIMILLIVLGLVSPSQGVSGFASSATITVLCMFILSGGVAKTGVIQKIGHFVFGIAKNSRTLQILLIALIAAPISGLFSNTAVVAIFLPMVITLSQKSKTPATKLLIPLSFLSMLGGTLTLVGTSANILANSILLDSGLPTFGMFDFTVIGLMVLVVGIIYLVTIGPMLLPNRKDDDVDSPLNSTFFSELEIKAKSPLIGKTLKESKFQTVYDCSVHKIIRNGTSLIKGIENTKIKEKDIIMFSADEQRIIELNHHKHEKLLLDFSRDNRRMRQGFGSIAKMVVPNAFYGKTVRHLNFREKYGASIIGIQRQNVKAQRCEDVRLKRGEIFLVKAAPANLQTLQKNKRFIFLEEVAQKYDKTKTWKALSIMALVVGLAAFGVLPIMVSALLGVFLMFFTQCLKAEEVYEAVSWDIIFLLAGLIPLGIAMQESGAADLIAGSLVGVSESLPPFILLCIMYLVTTLLTEVISNNAAVVLLVPISISIASKLGLNPLSLTLIVMFAASTSLLSPVGYQTNTMVYGAGNYKFTDFIKVGLLLNILLLFTTSFGVYYFIGV